MPDSAEKARAGALRTCRAGRAYARRSAQHLRRRYETATGPQRQTLGLTAGSALLGLAVAVTAVAATGPWEAGRRTAEQARASAPEDGAGNPGEPSGDPLVLPPVAGVRSGGGGEGGGAGAVPSPSRAALADLMAPLLADKALGDVRAVSVRDASGTLYTSDADKPVTPASTVKIATAAAALSARGPGHRIATRVLDGGDDRVVLAGGGNPVLDAEGIDDLARGTARELKKKDAASGVSVRWDESLYTGPRLHRIGPNENLAPVTPLMLDEGRLDDSGHGPAPRSADPARRAAEKFRDALEKHGVTTKGKPQEANAPGKAPELARHLSAPLSDLVERMLTDSDNDLAEALARQTALADGHPAGFAGAGRAVHERLEKLGVPVQDARFEDGSGLDRADRVTANLLTGLLARAGEPGTGRLRPVLTGLPVARFTGTLDGRYGGEGKDDGKAGPGAGVVRAKTGTLSGVNTLAGTVVDADGRLLVFSLLAGGTKDPDAAQKALDRIASALAGCGCGESPSAR